MKLSSTFVKPLPQFRSRLLSIYQDKRQEMDFDWQQGNKLGSD